MRLRRHLILAILSVALAFAVALSALWVVRARIAGQFAEYYFRQHGVNAAIDVKSFGLWSVSARFALGPGTAPDVAAEQIQLVFDPLRWMPYLTEVKLIRPVVRARVEADGKVTLGSLQSWIGSLTAQKGQSRFVSNDLAISLTGLRALLNTPAGALEVDGDLRLRQNRPVSARLQARPAMVSWQGTSVALRNARLAFDGTNLSLALSGDLMARAFAAQKLDVVADVRNLRWSEHGASAASAHLNARTAVMKAGAVFDQFGIDMVAQNPGVSGTGAYADVRFAASADPRLDTDSFGLRDPRMNFALKRDLAHVRLDGSVRFERQGDTVSIRSIRPLLLEGANGLALRLPALSASKSPRGLNAGFDAHLRGGGMPAVNLSITDLAWTEGRLSADVAIDARFSYLMLQGATLSAKGTFSWQDGHYALSPESCVLLSLAAFHSGQTEQARDVRGTLCPGNRTLLSGEGPQWRLSGVARGVSAFLPLANAQLDKAETRVRFAGSGSAFEGSATITTARLSDRAFKARFNPLQGSGLVTVANGRWRGRLMVTGSRKKALGTVTFDHDMANGAGEAHIDAAHLVFAQKDLQPEDLSPLLAQFRQADGTANFHGDVRWTPGAIASSGTLSIGNLDFLTPLGRAHALKSVLAFTSLVPFRTADNQEVTISRIDWTLPISMVDLHFSFDSQAARIGALTANLAEGHVALGPLTINFATPSNISGTAHLSSIALDTLIRASNLENKIKLTGKVSGTIPFVAGPQNIHITDGHIVADGPGKLSVDRSLWVQDKAVQPSNAVQDFAYQALENLAFDQMKADLNSVANGRLQIVFHVKGRSDPPKPQIAEVALSDILNGTALQKPIALPSGTPIDLTLDTSLNFDELLKSYAEAWSKSLSPAGQPDSGPGAKP